MKIGTFISYKQGNELIEKSNFDCWVCSYGGCGTNYFRKVLNVWNIKDKSIIVREEGNIVKSVHMFYPPVIKRKILLIYIYGNPILSLKSIFRRKLFRTMAINAGRKVYNNSEEVDRSKFIKNLKGDLLRFEYQFNNWTNSNCNYPILFINYDKLKDNFTKIEELLKSDYNITLNKKAMNAFKQRSQDMGDFTPEELDKLNNIYGNLIKRINDLPDFWIKEPLH